MDYKKEIIKILKGVDILKSVDVTKIIEEPKDKNNGDFSLPCFIISKTKNKDPKEIANAIYDDISENKLFNVFPTGPFLNFKLKNEFLIKDLKNNKKVLSGLKKIGGGKKILIEYSSPNTNKSQHLGHLRNNILGVSLSNIYKACGYKVVTSCIFNDKGISIAKTIYGYIKFGNNSEPINGEKPDKFVSNFYVLASQHEKDHKEATEEINEINRKWEAGDPEIINIWKKLTAWVYKGYDQTYKTLDCHFDKIYHESEIFENAKKIVISGVKKRIFKESAGAIVSDLRIYNLPDTVLLKSDKTSLYITQDLYLAKIRNKEIAPKKTIYIVANEQNLHFKQLFAMLEQLKIGKRENYFHLNYGYISLPEGRMKSREGTVIDADDLINEIIQNSYKKLLENNPELNEKELKKKSEIIGIGATKFQFLKVDAFSDFVFDPKKSIELAGDTSVYLQYTYARILSLLKKSKIKQKDFSKFNTKNIILMKDEVSLMRELNSYDESIIKSLEGYNPSILCKKLLDIANTYNNFYQKNKIISLNDKNLQKIRLFLSFIAKEYIKHGLKLLGIKTVEKM